MYDIDERSIDRWLGDDPDYIQHLVNLWVHNAEVALRNGYIERAHKSIRLAAHLLNALQSLNDD